MLPALAAFALIMWRNNSHCTSVIRVAEMAVRKVTHRMRRKAGRKGTSVSESGLSSQMRDDFETIAIRLLEVAARCEPGIQHELMKLADDIVNVMET